ncbi:hypothetical protein AMTRI_Chr13g115720 [Amborella trichopoda]|uniref:polycomb group protein EMBRYONIC FLOWER 2 isoform X1 n=2 Tax=Amborella trichopoda TaxID=13333 RepID=UPI0009BF8B47|nr:polycomb group protein EMBRYONIC FLOWER 2 isoform X1 [Amborella trichopoda]|eukprot:XP_020519282.1 polycomb group protein EMBRYONIC FLOWER 2 isoform X1 [Amborella trichopoda]
MPGLPLLVREASSAGCSCRHSRSLEQMCRQDSRVHLSVEEAAAAEESLSIYCKPVELYNILQRRALRHPSFLQRCLHYKIQAKRQKRIKITCTLTGLLTDGGQSPNVFPLYVLLATPISNIVDTGYSAVYRFNRACILTAFSESGRRDVASANFLLPEIGKLAADAKAGNLSIIFVTCAGDINHSADGVHMGVDRDMASVSSILGGHCLWGKLPMDSLSSSWEKSPSLRLGHRSEMQSSIEMHSSFLERGGFDGENCIRFQIHNLSTVQMRVQVNVSVQEVGAKERSPYDSYTYDDIPISSLSHIIRLRAGNVIFNYRYYNNTLQKTEVTEDFSCPFCLVRCASFKGLRYHLSSSHDLFNFEFWVTEEYQAVNVSVRSDSCRSEAVTDGVDPKLQTFYFCSKQRRHRKYKYIDDNVKHVEAVKSDSPEIARPDCLEKDASTSSCQMAIETPANQSSLERSSKNSKKGGKRPLKEPSKEKNLDHCGHNSQSAGVENGFTGECGEPVMSSSDVMGVCAAKAQASLGSECALPGNGSNLAPQCAKVRKLSAERMDPKNRALLQKRQFFHSHRAQPMALEQVFSDRDSEDEVDDDIADFEDRRMLDDFVDVTKDEKQIMHLWNSFVRKQRVLADGHIPWACEAFSKLHGCDLVRAPALIWCWRLFMMKLWNHCLLDARTMNNCNIILDNFKKMELDPQQNEARHP